MSERSPAFQFYPKDFLSSTKVDQMSMTERGVYITLLSRCWLDHGLPTDQKALAKMVRMKTAQFERMWDHSILRACFVEKDGKLLNERMERERAGQAEYRAKQAANGASGGRPKKAVGFSGLSAEKPVGYFGETQPVSETKPKKSSASAICVLRSASASAEERTERTEAQPFDVWFEELKRAYPPTAVSAGHLTMTAFCDVLFAASEGAVSAFALMMANLENQKRGYQWRVKRMIPRLDKWLREGLWLQQHDEQAPAADQLAPRTNRTLAAAANILREGQS